MTRGVPAVNVPVLSNSTVRASASASRAAPSFTTTPVAAARAIPDTTATGAASTSGHRAPRTDLAPRRSALRSGWAGPPAAGNLRSRRHSTLAALRAVTRKTGISGAMLANSSLLAFMSTAMCDRAPAATERYRRRIGGRSTASTSSRWIASRRPWRNTARPPVARTFAASSPSLRASPPDSAHRRDRRRRRGTRSPDRFAAPEPPTCTAALVQAPRMRGPPRSDSAAAATVLGRPPRYIHRSKSWVDVMRHQTFTSPRRDSFGWLAAGCRLGAARANGEVVDDVDHAGDHPSKPTHGGDILRPQHLPL